MIKAAITGVGGYLPETILNNHDLEQMVETTDEWILSRTGIKERRILKEPNQGVSRLAIGAAQDLINKKGIDPTTIDLVLVATITPDYLVAATAAYVASAIGATQAFGFDLAAACSGFLYGMSVAMSYVNSGRYKKVLLIGADKMSSIVNYKDRTTCIIFGDGAGAVLIEPSSNAFGWEDEYLKSNGASRASLMIKAGGSAYPTSQETLDQGWHNLYQDGKTVFKYAVSEMAAATQKILEHNHLTSQEINYLVPHQANKRIIDATAKHIGLGPEKVLMNIERYGNTTAATIPLLLYDYEAQLQAGDKLLFAAFGGGFTWGAAYLTWAY
ncbi:MAG: beta-ketoacyl-ACP synthase III [Flavobacteriaceae bacterium]|jgi:3-oxoacyl-[acyl-carrier-protein] synthase-3